MKKLAILALAAGITAATAATVASRPTFTKDVAPIVHQRCAGCHRAGEVAPMELLTYEQVRPWSAALREAVLLRKMPPWFAHPDFGKFRNDRRLSQREIDTLVAWVDAGCPKGDDKDMPAPPARASGWSWGEPDLIIPMPVEASIPAEGRFDYQYYYVPIPFAEDKFLEAVELRPGNRAVVHHSIVNISTVPEDKAGDLVSGKKIGQMQWKLVGQAPGKGFERHRPGAAKRLSPGMYFEFNMHYNPTGRPEKDRSSLGLWFAKGPVKHEVITKTVSDVVLVGGETVKKRPNIPAHASHWEIVGHMPIKEDITLYAFAPHMHLRGKDMKFILERPDGSRATLLYVPKYDFNWQLHYELVEPLKIAAGSKLVCIAHYDNSLNNPYNPAPEKEVLWAEQSWDEMFSGFIEYSVDSRVLGKPAAAPATTSGGPSQ